MLFDLRSRRRRRIVKTVYVFLALLIGVGLIGFGVGTGGNFGGLFNAAGAGGGAGTAGVALERTLTTAQKHARASPASAAAWAAVGRAAYNVSQLPDHYVVNQGYTKLGFQTLATLENAWTRYLKVLPAKPDATLASEVRLAFGPTPTGIQKWSVSETAQELVVEARPSYTEYANLAYFAYQAHEKSRGDLAAARAIALAPKKSQKQLKAQLEVYKIQAGYSVGATGATGTSGASTGATGATHSTGASPSSSSGSTSSSSSSSTSSSSSSASKSG
jgi:hypothetical protein